MTQHHLLILSLLIGFYMSWNIGANDVANAMGTSVGSGALRLGQAVAIAAVLEFCGAYFWGHRVADTLQNSLLIPSEISIEPELKSRLIVIGMLASLLSAGVWLQISTYFGWPVSTTHTTVGAIVGFGLIVGGSRCIAWPQVAVIAFSWVISPLLGALISYAAFAFLRRKILTATRPMATAKRVTPWISALFFCLVSGVLLYDEHREFWGVTNHVQAMIKPLGVGLMCGLITHFFVRKLPAGRADPGEVHYRDPKVVRNLNRAVKNLEEIRQVSTGEFLAQINLKLEELQSISRELVLKLDTDEHSEESRAVEGIFAYLQIGSAAFMAFSHGANDVANAVGPLSWILKSLTPQDSFWTSPRFIFGWGAAGIVIGLITWGWRVINTIGRKITELTPTRGFAAEFGCATIVMLSSQLGLPVSTTHTLVGSIFGVGLARGLGTLNFDMAGKIAFSWLVTIPVGGVLSVIFYSSLNYLIGT